MIGSRVVRWGLVLAVGVALGGCRVKSVESFETSVNPSPATPGKGDPYTYGGIAEGSGGLQTKTGYATDSKSSDPLAATETGKAGRIDEPRIAVAASAQPATVAPGTAANPALQSHSAAPSPKKH